jgi:hypothetical protein
MALLAPNEGESKMLEYITGKAAQESLVLCLYTNNKTPAEADTLASYTEASGFGYANKTLTAASWSMVAGDPTYASYPQETWTFTGALGNVYGYFIKSATSGKVLWAEQFTNGPYNVQNNGDQIKVTPRLELA